MGTPQENFDQGVAFRMTGNEAFKKQDYKKALTNYYNALLHLKAVGGQASKDQYKKASDEQLVMIYNNMSAVFAKQDKWDRVLTYAKKANELDPENTKSKFRMGQAYLQLENVDQAKTLLEEVLALNPDDVGVKKELHKVAAALKQSDDKEKLIYRTLMSKLAADKK